MTRSQISNVEFTRIKNGFVLSSAELEEPPQLGQDHSPWYVEHQRLCVTLDDLAETKGWNSRDKLGYQERIDVYVNFDCFRSRVIYTEMVPELRDEAEREILEILSKPQNQKYCVVVNFQSSPSPGFVVVDQIAHGKIYTLIRNADALDS